MPDELVRIAFRTSDLGKCRIVISLFCPVGQAETLENDVTCAVMSFLHGRAARQRLEERAAAETGGRERQ